MTICCTTSLKHADEFGFLENQKYGRVNGWMTRLPDCGRVAMGWLFSWSIRNILYLTGRNQLAREVISTRKTSHTNTTTKA